MFTFKSLRLDYGQETAKLAKRYVNVIRSISIFKTHLQFTTNCRDMDLIPRSLRIKRLVHTAEGQNILAQAERRLVIARIHECRSTLRRKDLDLFFIRRQLEHRIPDLFHSLDSFARTCASTVAKKQRISQDRKLTSLTKADRTQPSADVAGFVKNISSGQLSPVETSVLAKGHGFNLTTARPPLAKMVAAVEDGIRHLDSSIQEQVRLKPIGIMSKIQKQQCHNITREEHKALRSLQEDSKIVILPADKGNSTVVLDRQDYDGKIRDLLDNSTYENLKKDPTSQIQTKLNKILADIFKKYPDARALYLRLNCRNDFRSSPLRALSCYLHKVLSPLTGNTPTHVRNSAHFVERVSPLTISADECLVSFDVVSLFTNVPIPLAVDAARMALERDNDLATRTNLSVHEVCRLLDFCLSGTYFSFNGEYYKQTTRTAMGASISVTAANLVMESIEERALQSPDIKPKTFLRYVDDCFCILKNSDVDEFLARLNRIEPSIQFTVELERDNVLPFLDVLVKREGSDLKFTVYRKPTHTGRYLRFDSNHPTCHKASVVSSLFSRAKKICLSEKDRKKEEAAITSDLKKNGYTSSFVQRVARRQARGLRNRPRHTDDQTCQTRRITMPYVKGISESLTRILAKEGIRVSHKPVSTIGHYIPRPKDRPPKEKAQGVVYKIPCNKCSASCIGETKNFPERLRQHKNDVRKSDIERSALAEYCQVRDHPIDLQNACIIDLEDLPLKEMVTRNKVRGGEHRGWIASGIAAGTMTAPCTS
ncbi:uncharacterized protein LOC135374214 [Ornithodoros turicata]|uniref:uncharacterized protein LOC135374214 n=1 Tax=Ornithodoros turicata TaxID=34597 RepID=UPI003139B9D3